MSCSLFPFFFFHSLSSWLMDAIFSQISLRKIEYLFQVIFWSYITCFFSVRFHMCLIWSFHSWRSFDEISRSPWLSVCIMNGGMQTASAAEVGVGFAGWWHFPWCEEQGASHWSSMEVSRNQIKSLFWIPGTTLPFLVHHWWFLVWMMSSEGNFWGLWVVLFEVTSLMASGPDCAMFCIQISPLFSVLFFLTLLLL